MLFRSVRTSVSTRVARLPLPPNPTAHPTPIPPAAATPPMFLLHPSPPSSSARAHHTALACSPPGPATAAPLGLVRRGFPRGRSSDGSRPQAAHTSWEGKELGGDGVGSSGARSELNPSPPEPAVDAPLGLGFPWGITTTTALLPPSSSSSEPPHLSFLLARTPAAARIPPLSI